MEYLAARVISCPTRSHAFSPGKTQGRASGILFDHAFSQGKLKVKRGYIPLVGIQWNSMEFLHFWGPLGNVLLPRISARGFLKIGAVF